MKLTDILTSNCAFVHKTSEQDEHLYVIDDTGLDLLPESLHRMCLCRAKAAVLKCKKIFENLSS